MIDAIKGVGVFLVILGHNKSLINDWIYSFHIPLFFILSGIFHSSKDNYYMFFLKKIRTLIIPYIFLSIPLYIFWLIIGRKFGEAAIKKTPILEASMGVLLGTNITKISSIEWGTPMWFLPCLFLVVNIFYFISHLKKNKIIILNIVFIFLNILLSKLVEVKLPWSILTALVALPYYSLGYYLKNFFLKNENYKINIFLSIVLLIINLIGYRLNGRTDMFQNNYNNFILFYITGFSGSVSIILFFKNIKVKYLSFLIFMGMNSIVLLAFHGRAMTFMKLLWVLLIKNKFIEGDVFTAFLYTIIQILICIPLIRLLNNNLPFMIGKNGIFEKQKI